MPLTAAEKQGHREKRDQDANRRADYLQKEKQRYTKYNQEGKVKLVK